MQWPNSQAKQYLEPLVLVLGFETQNLCLQSNALINAPRYYDSILKLQKQIPAQFWNRWHSVICDLKKFTYQFSSTHATLLLLENYFLKFITISPKIR